jgi:5'-methylthioadenosine nucleosidase
MAATVPVRRVVVLFAMQEEAAPFVRACNLQRIPSSELGWPSTLPLVAYRGTVGDACDVFACWTGKDERFLVNNVATTAAAVASYAAVCEFRPDLVISAGTAGGFLSSTACIGDVFLSSKCIFHSRRIPSGANLEE